VIRAIFTILALGIFSLGMLIGIFAAQTHEKHAVQTVCKQIVLDYLEGIR